MSVSITIALALLTTGAAQADSYLDETCVECGTCDPFPTVIDEADVEVEWSLVNVDALTLVSIEGLEAEYVPDARACQADSQGTWHALTFVFALPIDEWSYYGMMMKHWDQQGSLLGGPLNAEIEYLDRDGTLWLVELGDLDRVHGSLLWDDHTSSNGYATDPDHPGSFLYELTLEPAWGTVSAWVPSRGW